jgi:phage tail sheath gpL-like
MTVAAERLRPRGDPFDRISHAIRTGYTNAFLGVTLEDVVRGLAREINEDVAQDRSAAVAYTHVDIELVGVERKDDVWVVTVNGVQLPSYTVTASDDLADVALALADLINDEALDNPALAGISASATDESIEVTGTSLFTISITAQALGIGELTSGRTAAARISAHGSTAAYLVVQGPAFEFEVLAPYVSATLELTGTPQPGQNWTLLVNGKPYMHRVQFGDTPDTVAAALAGLVDGVGEFDAMSTGSAITLSPVSGAEALFTVDFAVAGSGVPAATIIASTPVAGARTVAEVRLSGTPAEGSLLTLTLSLGGEDHHAVYPVEIGDTLQAVAAGLAELVDQDIAGFSASVDGTTLFITSDAGGVFTVALAVNGAPIAGTKVSGTRAGVTYHGAHSIPAWMQARIELTGATPNVGGPVWTVVLNGVEYSYTLPAAPDPDADPNSLGDVANGLADAINAGDVFEAAYVSADIALTGTTAKGDVWRLVLNGASRHVHRGHRPACPRGHRMRAFVKRRASCRSRSLAPTSSGSKQPRSR